MSGIDENMQLQRQYHLLCEDSLEGIFSGIYFAYLKKLPHDRTHIITGEKQEYTLFCEEMTVKVNKEFAVKVQRTLERIMGEQAFYYLCLALSAPEPDKADAVYHTVVDCITKGSGATVMKNLADVYVNRTFKLARKAEREFDHLRGFVRFGLVKGEIMLSRITPQNDVLIYLMPHFADRFPQENFIIADTVRAKYGVHPKGKAWYIVNDELCHIPGEDEDEGLVRFLDGEDGAEKNYQELFRLFVDTIAIKERTNLQLQRQMLPLRFRGNMTEFTS